jgi:pyruvate ferredoxin oxidoreductase gamma subunit
MTEIRFHGRGGHGVVTAAELLAMAAFHDGLHAQAIPSFGSERTGAPVVAYCRIAEQPIRSHDPVVHPDVVVVGDATLLHLPEVLTGLTRDGYLVLNAAVPSAHLSGHFADHHVIAVPGTRIALEHLGRPLPHAALLGSLAVETGIVSLAALVRAIEERFPPELAAGNVACALAAAEARADA